MPPRYNRKLSEYKRKCPWEYKIVPILIYVLLMIFMSIITSIRNIVFLSFFHTLSHAIRHHFFLKKWCIIKFTSLFCTIFLPFPHSSNIRHLLSWSNTQFELIITLYFTVKIETVRNISIFSRLSLWTYQYLLVFFLLYYFCIRAIPYLFNDQSLSTCEWHSLSHYQEFTLPLSFLDLLSKISCS